MSPMKISFVQAAVALFLRPALFGQLPTQKVLTIDVAQTIAREAMAKCRADGHKIAVRVVDSGNVLKAFLRDDGATSALVDLVRMKANFVIAMGIPSGPPPNLPPGQAPPGSGLPDTANVLGGVPIKVDGQVIGAVAVAGAGGDIRDVNCANAGLAKVAEKLK